MPENIRVAVEPNHGLFHLQYAKREEEKITKRLALSSLAKIFDPLGWLTPVTITAKLFIQHLWKQQMEWDLPLEESLGVEWRKFKQNLHALKNVKIPRWYQIRPSSTVQLHGFADASEKAYAAVVYLKVDSQISIVAAKSKVNPIKKCQDSSKIRTQCGTSPSKATSKDREYLGISGKRICME